MRIPLNLEKYPSFAGVLEDKRLTGLIVESLVEIALATQEGKNRMADMLSFFKFDADLPKTPPEEDVKVLPSFLPKKEEQKKEVISNQKGINIDEMFAK